MVSHESRIPEFFVSSYERHCYTDEEWNVTKREDNRDSSSHKCTQSKLVLEGGRMWTKFQQKSPGNRTNESRLRWGEFTVPFQCSHSCCVTEKKYNFQFPLQNTTWKKRNMHKPSTRTRNFTFYVSYEFYEILLISVFVFLSTNPHHPNTLSTLSVVLQPTWNKKI